MLLIDSIKAIKLAPAVIFLQARIGRMEFAEVGEVGHTVGKEISAQRLEIIFIAKVRVLVSQHQLINPCPGTINRAESPVSALTLNLTEIRLQLFVMIQASYLRRMTWKWLIMEIANPRSFVASAFGLNNLEEDLNDLFDIVEVWYPREYVC
jgi:hypothetical protein